MPPGSAAGEPEILLTAAEAFPEFERLFLNARDRVSVAMRIFDPRTRLHAPEGRAIGTDWFDLVVHTLRRGVRLRMIISDFDPIVRPDYHQRATRCRRLLLAAGEVSGNPHLLSVTAAMHPARVGLLASLFLWPRARGYLKTTEAELNALSPARRRRRISELPALRPYFDVTPEGVRLRPLVLPRLNAVTHHQKLAVADEERLYIGGLDLNDRRFDTPDHDRPASETWHDTQVLLQGAVAGQADHHIRTFLDVVEGKAAAPDLPDLLRTLSARRKFSAPYISPKPVLAKIADAHLARIGTARKLIYLESQFFRDRALARALVRAARRNPGLNLLLVLPSAPDDVAFRGNTGRDARYGEYLQAKCVRMLQRGFGRRIFIASPAQRKSAAARNRTVAHGAPIIYLHAKVSIFDRDSAIVSSANLNGRSFRWDTEAAVELTDRPVVDRLLRRCMTHWYAGEIPEAFLDPATAVASWRAHARANVARRPEDREGYLLPYRSGPARRFGRDLPGIPEDIV
ncbi:phospholipase D-like domain-containing protein [Jannaschia sp. S6380]|uniref:phospholipase D family protein n=1 Tax=Jannaschia sp. S6380 TaxID=2926408 RepID=UPI001FF2F8F1|nr:phospholipase D-like domain-containing protein [Jannaschia sp. S6380]MCK0167196.1 phospholipase D-like domain-containing protein [Jannaschia sp. S6380]